MTAAAARVPTSKHVGFCSTSTLMIFARVASTVLWRESVSPLETPVAVAFGSDRPASQTPAWPARTSRTARTRCRAAQPRRRTRPCRERLPLRRSERSMNASWRGMLSAQVKKLSRDSDDRFRSESGRVGVRRAGCRLRCLLAAVSAGCRSAVPPQPGRAGGVIVLGQGAHNLPGWTPGAVLITCGASQGSGTAIRNRQETNPL